MRTHVAAFVALAGLAALTSACRTTGSKDATPKGAKAVEGRVESVGHEDGTVTVRSGDESRKILVMPETEIRIEDFKGSFEDLQEGQRVRASFATEGGQAEGVRIKILDKGVPAPVQGEAPADAAGAATPTPPSAPSTPPAAEGER